MASFIDDFNADFDAEIMQELGDNVTFIPASGGGGVAIQGEFDEKFYLTNAETGVETVTPAIECLESDVVNAQGGNIIRKGKSYTIKSVQPDGTGMALLILKKA